MYQHIQFIQCFYLSFGQNFLMCRAVPDWNPAQFLSSSLTSEAPKAMSGRSKFSREETRKMDRVSRERNLAKQMTVS